MEEFYQNIISDFRLYIKRKKKCKQTIDFKRIRNETCVTTWLEKGNKQSNFRVECDIYHMLSLLLFNKSFQESTY